MVQMEHDDFQLMHLSAFRYCLGRQTYIVKWFVDWLQENWSKSSYQQKIKNEIQEALDRDMAGSVMDVKEWTRVLQWENK